MLLLLVYCAVSVIHVSSHSCSYKGCHPVQEGKLNIHLIPHTHDDVGWLKTVDQYYYGSNKVHAPFGVQYILDSVVSELLKNKNRRFIYVESSFLWRWWQEQDADSQTLVSNLVREGRLQLVHGGWCMSDEATPHYSMLIDQMSFGLKFLKDTFGECGIPKIAWQIDPFGHSSEVALEFAEMGYDAVFFGRIDHEDYRERTVTKSMEMIWRPDTSLGERGELFTGILYNLYMPPNGFCFDTYCADEPIMDNPKLHGYNVNERITDFVREVRYWAESYKTRNVLVTMGGDFNYIVASSWFKNMDKLIKYINNKFTDVNVLYSTPACYVKALHETNTTWPVKDNDDFFPYGSDEHTYWTGYFTSRPDLKNMVYRANNVLQAVKQQATSLGPGMLEEEEMLMNRALGVAQHHDAVSGTEKQHVADDYALYLSQGLDASEKIFTASFKTWLGSDLPAQRFCRLLNISQCEESEGATRFTVSVYNPQSRKLSHHIRVPVLPGSYKVIGPTGEEIPTELVPVPAEVLLIPGRTANTSLELMFRADDVPPLGLLSYHVERFEGGQTPLTERQNLSIPNYSTNQRAPFETSQEAADDIIVDNGLLKLVFNESTGQLQFIEREGEKWAFHQNFYYYEGSKGYNYNSYNRASGAYIFRPAKEELVPVSTYANISIFRGKHVTEVYQQFGPWVSQVIRLYQLKDELQMHWLVGPIPVDKWIGKEVITRYKTQLLSEGKWYTDSNGRRLVQRNRNWRKSWNLTLTEPTASNYYPITSAAVVLGNKHRLTVLTDRPQGATSLMDGELDLMLHRRLLYDDSKGVSEPLDEQQYDKGLVARGVHIIQLSKAYKEPRQTSPNGNTTNGTTSTTPSTVQSAAHPSDNPPVPVETPYKHQDGAKRHRLEAFNLVYGPLLTFTRTQLSAAEWSKRFRMKFTGLLKNPLPPNVHLLTLERWNNASLLIRLEHLFEATEHPTLSQPVTIQLQDLLADYNVTRAVELTLGANEEVASAGASRLSWHHEGSRVIVARPPLGNDLSVTLGPMDIRTFQLFVVPHKRA